MKKILLLLVLTIFTVSCSTDDSSSRNSSSNYSVEFKTVNLPSAVTVTLQTTVNLQDNSQIVIDSDYDSNLDLIKVDLPNNTKSFQCEYYIEDGSATTMKFKDNINNVLVHQSNITQQTYVYTYVFQ